MAKVNPQEFMKKAEEILSTNIKIKESISVVDKKKRELQNKLEVITKEQEKYNKKISELKVLIERRKDKKQELLTNTSSGSGTNFNPLDIENDCNKILDTLIGSKYESDEVNPNLFFLIKAEQDTLKKLSDYSQTFGELKREYCEQHNLVLREMYFTDENDKIFLDSMIVKDCLFPLDNIVLKDYKPAIHVNFNRKNEEKDDENSKIVDSDKNQKNQKKESENEFITFFKDNIFIIIHFLILTIYILLWVFNLASIRDIQANNVIKYTFNKLEETYFNSRYETTDILEAIDNYIVKSMHFPTLTQLNSGETYNYDETNRK